MVDIKSRLTYEKTLKDLKPFPKFRKWIINLLRCARKYICSSIQNYLLSIKFTQTFYVGYYQLVFIFGNKTQQPHIYSCRKDIEQGFLILSLLIAMIHSWALGEPVKSLEFSTKGDPCTFFSEESPWTCIRFSKVSMNQNTWERPTTLKIPKLISKGL